MGDGRDDLDYYPTPPWATRACVEHLEGAFPDRWADAGTILEPCAGRGWIAGVLEEEGLEVETRDVDESHDVDAHGDFIRTPESKFERKPDWVVTNPPYETPRYHAADFVRRSLDVAGIGVTMLLRLSFEEPCENRKELLPGIDSALVVPRPRYVDGATDSMTSVWLTWLVDTGDRPGQYREYAPPSIRPPLEEREIPPPDKHGEGDDGDGDGLAEFMSRCL